HVVTLENPIEFLHRDINSSITQREIGVDTEDFRAGLRAALRQDPDVILIGELRDVETVDTALKAAETGRLVISTLHTPDAATPVARDRAGGGGSVERAPQAVSGRPFAGVLAPITTPFDGATGAVAPVHLRQNVVRLLDAGLDGVVVAGSTGESALLDPDE